MVCYRVVYGSKNLNIFFWVSIYNYLQVPSTAWSPIPTRVVNPNMCLIVGCTSVDAHPLGCTEQRDAETEREVIHWTSLNIYTLHPHPSATLGTDAVYCVVQLLLGCTEQRDRGAETGREVQCGQYFDPLSQYTASVPKCNLVWSNCYWDSQG